MDKDKQKQLLIDIMNEDAKDGLYKQQTAVQWLEHNIQSDMTFMEIMGLIKQAKEIEKKKMENAWEDAQDYFRPRTFEQYYN